MSELVGHFSLTIYHVPERARYEIVVPELDCRFSSTTLAATAADSLQGLLFFLHEKQRQQEQVQPSRPL